MPGSLYAAMNDMPKSTHGSSPWAEQYGRTMKQLVKDRASRADRSMQRHLGPSELGEECDRQVVSKMAAMAKTNNVSDPWASVMGTAGHAWVEDMYKWDNRRRLAEGMPGRWIAEMKVTPDPGDDPHPGTADLYDAEYLALVDHKFLGDTSRAKLIAKGPKRVYYVQLLLYRRGYQNLGLPVNRIVLLAWPRTKSSLDDLYVWEHIPTPEDEVLVDKVIAQTKERQQVAELVKSGALNIMNVKPTPSDDSCMFCPLYRPQAAYDPSIFGCPGTLLKKR